MDKYYEPIAAKIIQTAREDSFWVYFITLFFITMYVLIVLLACLLSVNQDASYKETSKNYWKTVKKYLTRLWFIPAGMLVFSWINFEFCVSNVSHFTDNATIEYDGVYKKQFQFDRVFDQEYIRRNRDLENNYVFNLIDKSDDKSYTIFVPTSRFYNTIDFEQKLLNTLNNRECLFVNLKITPSFSNLAIVNNVAKKEIQNAEYILFLIGTEDELLYSEEEPIGKYLMQQIKGKSIPNIDDDKEISTGIDENRRYFINSITLDYINNNWCKQVVLIFDDGSSEQIVLDSSIKYIQDSNNFIVFDEFSSPTELHFIDKTVTGGTNINISNEVKITNEESSGENNE